MTDSDVPLLLDWQNDRNCLLQPLICGLSTEPDTLKENAKHARTVSPWMA